MTGALNGMTDSQFKAFIRELISNLEEALEINPDNEKLKKTLIRLKDAL